MSALDDPSFNADTIAHDLLRAINQEEYTPVFVRGQWGMLEEDRSKERRKVDADKVISSLENLTPSQVAEVKRRYFEFERKTSLEQDLFEGGQSERPSTLTPGQADRIRALLKGTKAEPFPAGIAETLKSVPPEAAAQISGGLTATADAVAELHQFEADAIELHELLGTFLLGAGARERVMVLLRRPPRSNQALASVYAQRFGADALKEHLEERLYGLQRTRAAALLAGDWARADACAIEDKRRDIEALDREELPSGVPDWVVEDARRKREKKKEELSGDIEGILEHDRQEALADPANAARSSSDAVAERVAKVLAQHVGEGPTLGSELTRTLGREHAGAIGAMADTWNTSGGASLVEEAAYQLAAMERAGTTKATVIIAMLRSFHDMAKRDVLARVRDPAVPLAEKQAIGEDVDAAVAHLGQRYILEFRRTYFAVRGKGRTYDEILESCTHEADKTLLEALEKGGGKASELEELQHAMGMKDVDTVKAVLRRQPNRGAIDALVAKYNEGGHDLRKELFGTTLDGDPVPPELAEEPGGAFFLRGVAKGRDAAQIAEQLSRPSATGTPDEARAAEVQWIAAGGKREYDVTMGNKGVVGSLREIGGDPETERLLEQSNDRLALLQADWSRERDPAKRRHFYLEMVKTRATLSGDADAYEKENERILGELQSALSFAVSIALAVALPGAGAGLAAFLEATAIQVAANVAANVVIKGDAYSWDDLKGDVLGGVLGAAGGKFGEELLGRAAAKIAGPTGRATIGASERLGIPVAMKEVSAGLEAAEKTTLAVEEFEAAQTGREAGHAIAGETSVAAATTVKAEATLFETAAREAGAFFGGLEGGKLPSGDLSLSVDEVLKALVATGAGKAALHAHTAGAEPGGPPTEVVEEPAPGQEPLHEPAAVAPAEEPAAVGATGIAIGGGAVPERATGSELHVLAGDGTSQPALAGGTAGTTLPGVGPSSPPSPSVATTSPATGTATQGHHADEVAAYAANAEVHSAEAMRQAMSAGQAADIMLDQSAVGIVPKAAAENARAFAERAESAAHIADRSAAEASEWLDIARAAEAAGDVSRAQMALNIARSRVATARAQAVAATELAIRAKIAAVNPSGETHNCGWVLPAVDDALAGFTSAHGKTPASDPRMGTRWTNEVDAQVGQQWRSGSSEQAIVADLAARGDGATGGVFVTWQMPDGSVHPEGHFFNVVRANGVTFFVDGQSGNVAQSLVALFKGQPVAETWYMPMFTP